MPRPLPTSEPTTEPDRDGRESATPYHWVVPAEPRATSADRWRLLIAATLFALSLACLGWLAFR